MADSESGSPVSYSNSLVTICLSLLVSEIFVYDRWTTLTVTVDGPHIVVSQPISMGYTVEIAIAVAFVALNICHFMNWLK